MIRNQAEMLLKLESLLKKGGFERAYPPVAKFLLVLGPESDRGLVLAGAAFIDNSLEKLLRSYLVASPATDKLFSSNGPLSTFSSRNNMACSLGLIDPVVKRDIDLIRKIRNEFAHTEKAVALNSSEASNRVNELACLRDFINLLQGLQENAGVLDRLDSIFDGTRIRLLANIGVLLLYISDTQQKLKQLVERENHVDEWNKLEV